MATVTITIKDIGGEDELSITSVSDPSWDTISWDNIDNDDVLTPAQCCALDVMAFINNHSDVADDDDDKDDDK
jgi:hypothetical protein